jgi:hypothetical protein
VVGGMGRRNFRSFFEVDIAQRLPCASRTMKHSSVSSTVHGSGKRRREGMSTKRLQFAHTRPPCQGRPRRAIFTDMADHIDRPGGWLMKVTTPGNPPLVRHYKVYVFDQARATARIRAQLSQNETCEPVKQLNVHEFTGDKMWPGDVKQHV